MAVAKKTKTTSKVVAKAKASQAMLPESGDCCAGMSACCQGGAFSGWGAPARLWWAVTWRTFVWISLPLMLVQFAIQWLQAPDMAVGILTLGAMMLMQAPTALMSLAQTAEFWFFIAVTAYSILGAMYIYGYLAAKGRFGGVEMTLVRRK